MLKTLLTPHLIKAQALQAGRMGIRPAADREYREKENTTGPVSTTALTAEWVAK
ncbi:hypothetical protein H8L32_20925 [Undibacterium sp. CY18W]|uniref:Uncharacterized protein n=1 Tax=Undibacterium hunanense TaxID=2762292 RepID=A0ABR6ZVP5_9BURK|nr:hypothetical protein [Undibacterium hunanense]MBC3919947.1 hypothetical protein [Undibacterium hunanense]